MISMRGCRINKFNNFAVAFAVTKCMLNSAITCVKFIITLKSVILTQYVSKSLEVVAYNWALQKHNRCALGTFNPYVIKSELFSKVLNNLRQTCYFMNIISAYT